MRLGLRLLFVFCLIQGIAAFFVLRIFGQEIKPSVREVVEEQMVDAANLLAELAAPELVARSIASGPFSEAVQAYQAREVKASIWGLTKQRLDYRIYVTDAAGTVQFDSAGYGLGQDYSRWRDVSRTLAGQYGARTTRSDLEDETSAVMYVAAPVRKGGKTIGVLSVAKPLSAVQGFVDRAERRVLQNGLLLLAISAAVGVAVTLWVVWQVRRVKRYVQNVQASSAEPPPDVPGELGDLAKALGDMRQRLDGKQYIEDYVTTLTHELKSPLAALKASSELLQEPLPEPQRKQFAQDVAEQTERLERLVQRVLELARLEQGAAQVQLERVPLHVLLAAPQEQAAAHLRAKGLQLQLQMPPAASASEVQADATLFASALSNLLDNAMAHAPPGSTVVLGASVAQGQCRITVRDTGPGAPAFAFPRLGERFFTTQRPDGTRPGTGLGLAITQRIAQLHKGSLQLANAEPGPGFEATLVLPLAG